MDIGEVHSVRNVIKPSIKRAWPAQMKPNPLNLYVISYF